MQGLRAKQKQSTRRALLDAALVLSGKKGFSAVGLREITRLAGVAPSTFYRHFSNLGELGLALSQEMGVTLRRLMRQARQRAVPGLSPVRTSVETFLDFLDSNPNHFRLLIGESTGEANSFRLSIRKELKQFVEELETDLRIVEDKGEYPLTQIRETAEAVVAVLFTAGAAELAGNGGRRVQLRERLIRQIRLVLRGSRALAEALQSTTGRATGPTTELAPEAAARALPVGRDRQ